MSGHLYLLCKVWLQSQGKQAALNNSCCVFF
jgi:hypothetical protein